MFEENLKSILENGQEEVPEHIWKGVAEGLDKAARRRTVVLWFGRAAVVAAAAAIAVGNIDYFSQRSFKSGNSPIPCLK